MDGTLAALFLIAGLTDMGINHCGDGGCLAQSPETERFSISAGDVDFQKATVSKELYLRYDFGRRYGPFQPVAGASLTADGTAWIGIGAAWTQRFAGDRAYVQLALMPGLYSQGSGPDLGHAVQFRSGVEVGYETSKGVRFGLSYDHRSNAELSGVNPGMETVQFRVSIPVK
ncbi:Lipid A 3-O-deacylase (PagL) [Salinihabitans flavidus]|uniref:Lipid A 3-O-deacylase (PagL) n=1 Tax=Salinihabitans flavidus TaxID=569882 RepID=A0A1H8R839_9RHOB|nr:acyloxyacyl hydrolase [Salinihabitans flavidus]SEO62516.1 Lipid A 3-O-deacylase (PagL) [Salinihabitans flavidus]